MFDFLGIKHLMLLSDIIISITHFCKERIFTMCFPPTRNRKPIKHVIKLDLGLLLSLSTKYLLAYHLLGVKILIPPLLEI